MPCTRVAPANRADESLSNGNSAESWRKYILCITYTFPGLASAIFRQKQQFGQSKLFGLLNNLPPDLWQT
jgi:hypothetical protein